MAGSARVLRLHVVLVPPRPGPDPGPLVDALLTGRLRTKQRRDDVASLERAAPGAQTPRRVSAGPHPWSRGQGALRLQGLW